MGVYQCWCRELFRKLQRVYRASERRLVGDSPSLSPEPPMLHAKPASGSTCRSRRGTRGSRGRALGLAVAAAA
eukprot:11542738-Alexandrium_andersonii.AAC.1